MRKSPWRKKTIGFIGLGRMGSAFCRNLIADGHAVLGTDPSPAARARLRRMGGRALASPREVAEAVDVLFISVPNSKVSLRVARGREGFLASRPGRAPEVVIDTTTADPEDSRRLAEMCRRRGVPFLDGCVSGNSGAVARREGLFLVGGEKEVYRKVSPLLGRMLSDHLYCGPAGAGATLKVVVNYLTSVGRCAIAEALRLGVRGGFRGEFLLGALGRSGANSPQLRRQGPKMIGRRYANPVSTLDVLAKDIRLGLKLAARVGARTPLGRASLPIYREAQRAGYGGLDSTVVCRVYEDREKRGTSPRARRRAPGPR